MASSKLSKKIRKKPHLLNESVNEWEKYLQEKEENDTTVATTLTDTAKMPKHTSENQEHQDSENQSHSKNIRASDNSRESTLAYSEYDLEYINYIGNDTDMSGFLGCQLDSVELRTQISDIIRSKHAAEQ